LLADFIPQAWRDTRGQGIKLALIDTGADLQIHSLGHLDQPGRKFFVGKPGFTVIDHSGRDKVNDGEIPGGHGTRLAGVLAGKSNEAKQDALDGIAHQAEVFIIKARHNFSDNSGDFTNARSLLDGIRLAISLGVQVAVIAQSLPLAELNIPESEIQEVLKAAEESGILIFNSVENREFGEDWTGLSTKFFPANMPSIIKVAAAPGDIADKRPQIEAESIHFLLGGFNGKVYGTGNRLISPKTSNSYAAAIMGGVAAICASFLKSQSLPAAKKDVMALLAETCKPIAEADGVYPNPIILKNF
jgi:hypothetical protein